MSKRIDVALCSAYRLIHPMHTVIVSTIGSNGQPNALPIAWIMPTSRDPPLVAMSVAPQRYSHKLLEETEEFVINVPTLDLIKKVITLGKTTGRNLNKFEETGLTPISARSVKAPIIKECVAHLECRVKKKVKTGDHTVIIGEIIEAYEQKKAFTEKYNLSEAQLIFHLGGNEFAVLESTLHRG